MNQNEYVTTLETGLMVLRAFKPEDRGLTIPQVAKRVMIGRQHARRLLLTLEALGYLARPLGGDRAWSHEAFVPTGHVMELVRCIGVTVVDRESADKADARQVELLAQALAGKPEQVTA